MTEPAAPSAADPAPPSASGTEPVPAFDSEAVIGDPVALDPTGLLDPEITTDDGTADEVPSVVAVVVTSDPGAHFEEMLASIEAQDYPNLSLLVIDAASETPLAERVAAVVPDAFIHRMTGSVSYTIGANQALTLVTDTSFLLMCHDDVALDEHCVSAMVEELYRSNAAIVAPKMVKWDDPRRLLAIGRGSDRFGVQVDLVEPDEFDQDQYDSVRDVFVAPSGLQLIRADLFRELGGFDPAISALSSDLDLCWRAHTVGARVIAVPSAVVRHLDEHPQLGDANEQRRQLGRNRLRTLLVTASTFSLFRIVPLALILLVLEGVYSLIAGRRRQAAAAFGAISWNASNWGEISERRRELGEMRKVSDREVHELQVGGSARITGFFQGQFGAGQDRLAGVVGSVRSSLTGDESEANRNGAVIGSVVLFFLFFGSRHLITRGVVPVGQIPDLPSTSTMLGEFFGGWRTVNTGAPGNPPSPLFLLGLAKAAFFWGHGVLDLLLILAPLLLGAFGAWRLVRPFGSVRASSVAAAAYALNPLPLATIAAGRWDALVIWAVAPALIHSILRVQGLTPFGPVGGPPGPGYVRRDVPTRIIRFGLLVAGVSTLVPVVGIVGATIAVCVAVAALVVAKPAGITRLIAAAGAALVVPVALHLPWAFDGARRFSWARLMGPESPESTFDSLADLVRFAPGRFAPSVLVLGLLVAAGVSLAIAKGRRLDAAAAGWFIALGFWLIAWAGRRDLLPFEVPTAELLLAPAAAGIALAVGLGMRAVEVDLPRRNLGWRQLTAIVGLVGLSVAALGGIRGTLDGRWHLPTQTFGDFGEILAANSALPEGSAGPVRVLWLADPSVAPVDTVRSPGGASFFVIDGGRPTAEGRWSTGPQGFDAEIAARLDLAADGETIRVGQLLSSYGIDLIVVQTQLAPAPYVGPVHSPDRDPSSGVVRVLAGQLDLERVTGAPNLVVYRNQASRGLAVSEPDIAEVGSDPLEQLGVDPAAASRVDLRVSGAGSWTGRGPIEDPLRIAAPAPGWQVSIDEAEVSEGANGMVIVEGLDAHEGPFDVYHATPFGRWLAIAAQLVLVVTGLVLGQARWEPVELPESGENA